MLNATQNFKSSFFKPTNKLSPNLIKIFVPKNKTSECVDEFNLYYNKQDHSYYVNTMHSRHLEAIALYGSESLIKLPKFAELSTAEMQEVNALGAIYIKDHESLKNGWYLQHNAVGTIEDFYKYTEFRKGSFSNSKVLDNTEIDLDIYTKAGMTYKINKTLTSKAKLVLSVLIAQATSSKNGFYKTNHFLMKSSEEIRELLGNQISEPSVRRAITELELVGLIQTKRIFKNEFIELQNNPNCRQSGALQQLSAKTFIKGRKVITLNEDLLDISKSTNKINTDKEFVPVVMHKNLSFNQSLFLSHLIFKNLYTLRNGERTISESSLEIACAEAGIAKSTMGNYIRALIAQKLIYRDKYELYFTDLAIAAYVVKNEKLTTNKNSKIHIKRNLSGSSSIESIKSIEFGKHSIVITIKRE